MKMLRNLSALFIVFCMIVTLFAACGNTGGDADGITPPLASNSGGNDSDDDLDDGEMTTITWWIPDTGNNGSGSKVKMVEDLINSITESEINVHIDFMWPANADYPTQFALAMGNNESIDLAINTPPANGSFLTYQSKGMMMDITDLLDEYGQDVKALFGEELLAGTSIDGRVYGLSTYRILNSNFYVAMRTDLLEKAGVLEKAENMTTWAEYEEIMQAVVDQNSIYGTGSGMRWMLTDHGVTLPGNNFSEAYTFDMLGDTLRMLWTDQNGNVELYWDRADSLDHLKRVADWYDKGLVYPDSPHSMEGSEVLIMNGVYFSYVVQSEYGVEVNKSQSCGYPMTCVEVTKGYLSTTSVQKFGIFIPITSQQPEAAMKVLNLMYTNSDFMNALIWGVEGETYIINDEGEADYLPGADISTSGYHFMDFFVGNQFKTTPWKGLGGDFRERSLADFQSAPKSVYLGLSVDTSVIDTVVAALSAAGDEYGGQITSGQYSDGLYAEFLDKLDAAGINQYLELYQNAVKDFMG